MSISIDSANGDLYMGDVGQNAREEISYSDTFHDNKYKYRHVYLPDNLVKLVCFHCCTPL